MGIKKVSILFLLLIISMGAVSAAEDNSDVMEVSDATEVTQNDGISYTFKNLTDDVETSGDSFDVQHDYTFSNETDDGYVVIAKNNFVINGNNHIIDGNKQSGIFNITGNNVTISNLVFTNGKSAIGGIIDSTGEVTLDNVTFILNNVTFISDHTKYLGGAIANHGGTINCYNSRFIDNHAESGAAIFIEKGELNIKNTNITSAIPNRYGQIWARFSTVNIDYLNIINTSSRYSPAISLEKCGNTRITNSRFINLTADMSAGAISLKWAGNLYIRNCEFINTKSFKNAGAVIADYMVDDSNVTILDSRFYNSSSLIGGAYVQLGACLFMNNTSFINNKATHNGGAMYLSFTSSSEISNCTFDSNGVEDLEDYPGVGGAIYSDYNRMGVDSCKFINNSASIGNAIYLCDSSYGIVNTEFINNKNAIYSIFDKMAILLNNIYNNDSYLTNQTFEYAKYVDTPALTFDPINNNIDVTTIPSRFDLRDWGWVTPVKHQGHMGACWTFGAMSALESAILKAYGVEFNLSEGNLQHNMLRYSPYGIVDEAEGGYFIEASSYMIGWYGPVLEEYDVYDEVGKLSPYLTSVDYDVFHVQDVIFIPRNDETNNSEIKMAIMKYGALVGCYHAEYGDEGFYDSQKASQYTNVSMIINHDISIVGWDDNYSKDNFLITPPGDGAWIIKNSWGPLFGDKGYLYLSYYDKTFLSSIQISNFAGAIVIENTVPYNKNYQHAYAWRGNFLSGPGNITYANRFNAAEDDLLAAVGTYFERGGKNYTVTVYVNDEVKLVQDGITPYCGYHTIKLDKYIPIKKGDVFLVAITADSMPYIDAGETRVHPVENVSLGYYNGEWFDLYKVRDMVVCIKAYTVNDDTKIINAKNISVDYAGGKYFSVKVVTADGHAVGEGETVKFTINGKTTSVKTDKNGIAKIKITDGPGNYVMTTTYKGEVVAKNKVTVKHVLTATKPTVKKTAKSFTLKAVLKINGKAIKGKNIKFVLNGKTYTAKTNAKGIAQKTFNKKVINTLKKGKTYTVKVTYGKDTIKTTVTVK